MVYFMYTLPQFFLKNEEILHIDREDFQDALSSEKQNHFYINI